MAKEFKDLYPIDVENCSMEQPQFTIADYTPSYHRIMPYCTFGVPFLAPMEYTGWRDEAMAAQKTCAIYHGLNPSPVTKISGPDAKEYLKSVLVNNVEKFPIYTSKHGIMCDENGDMMANGVIMRLGEDSYEAHWMKPLEVVFDKSRYNATVTDYSMSRFIFQLIGPASLQIVEEAAECDFHDLKMCRMKDAVIAGKNVRVLRFGMTGGLAYEVHGETCDAKIVHKKLIEVGNKYGVRLLGQKAYMLSHTQGGSVQFGFHYTQSIPKEMVEEQMSKNVKNSNSYDIATMFYNGSVGEDMEKRFANPFEMGLGSIVNFDHDFVGKEALLAYKNNPKRTGVTLKWNEEDILDVYASQLRDEEPYKRFNNPSDNMNTIAHMIEACQDLVLNEKGEEIGVSGGRTESPFHRAMLSYASVDVAYAELGKEVYVLWGDVGCRQKKIRATVVPTPYNTNYSNRTFDVEEIPHFKK